jgi:hypothetical protein
MENAKWSLQHTIFLVVQIGISCVVVWFWFSVPAPGWAVAILAGVAAAMSVHGDMRPWQKVFWMILIGVLLVIELRAISKDRADSDAKALADRQAQDLAFRAVKDAQDKDFKETAGGLETAISGIKSTLLTANQTMVQTQPHAVLEVKEFQVPDSPTAPGMFKTGVVYHFNLTFTNTGNQDAHIVRRLGGIYVGKPDDASALKEIEAQFEKTWRGIPSGKGVAPTTPNIPGFWTELRTFSDSEIEDLLHKGDTIYVLRRMEYLDLTGIWQTDRCEHLQYQDSQLYLGVAHPCQGFSNTRYRPKQR